MADETEHTAAAAAPDAARDAGLIPNPEEQTPLPAIAAGLAAKAKDSQALKDVKDALVEAAHGSTVLWSSYLIVLFSLFIAVGGVTNRHLFLDSPVAVKLPFLNADLPLLGFFALGPAILLIVHTYVLLHFFILAGKVGDFDTELLAQITDEDERTRVRRQLPNNIFVQFLAGSREMRTGVVGFLLRLIAQISLVIGPVVLLVFFELQFLPYHDWAISWWHRIAVLADIALLWVLWPSIARGETAGLRWRDLRRGKIMALAVASLVPAFLVIAIATFPGEEVDNLPSLQFIPWKDGKVWRRTSLHDLLVAGGWSNRLVLPDFDVIDHTKFDSEEKIAALRETASLRERHLEGAVLIGATLRKANFGGALLQGALLGGAQLQGASLVDAQLQGASLGGAQLQGAWLGGAQLQGASLVSAQLQGASLFSAQLQGASLGGAQLQGASLGGAQLQGVSLGGARLQGASLVSAQLQGASLDRAQLQGASLDGAQLQGASLAGAQLEGASLKEVFAWRADARQAVWKDTRVVDQETGPKRLCWKNDEQATCDWSADSFEELKRLITDQVPEGDFRRATMERIEPRLDPTKALEGENDMAKVWAASESSSPSLEVYESRLAEHWREAGCAAGGAPYVLRKLLTRLEDASGSDYYARSPQKPALAAAFLDEEHCAGAHGLSEAEKARLKAIRDPPAPKQ